MKKTACRSLVYRSRISGMPEQAIDEHAGMKAGTGLLLAGGLNNLLDRYRRGYVVDYIRLKTPNKRLNKLVFNLSDIYVLIGAVILFITSRLHKDEQ